MNRKNRNILLITAIVFLVTSLVLTFYFGLKNTSVKPPTVENNYSLSKNADFNKTDKNSKSTDNLNENKEIEEKVTEKNDTNNKIKRYEKKSENNKMPELNDNKRTFKENYMINNRMSIRYVVLIFLESFLLGGAIVLLIYNNKSNKNNII